LAGPHVPSPAALCFVAALHAWHKAWQAVAQHTPSTQKPDAHWPAVPHTAPLASLALHVPASQKFPAVQSASAVHGDMQPPLRHTYGAQSTPVVTVTQPPIPSHSWPLTRLPVHTVAPQLVVASYNLHPPAPSHWPSCWQVLGASAVHSLSGSRPAATNPHWPSLP
jgi:hypothetical protein